MKTELMPFVSFRGTILSNASKLCTERIRVQKYGVYHLNVIRTDVADSTTFDSYFLSIYLTYSSIYTLHSE